MLLDPYVQWLCEQHHAAKQHPENRDLPLLQVADLRTSRYARILPLSTTRLKLVPVNTAQLNYQLLAAVQRSIYKHYAMINHSDALHPLTASIAHLTETLRQHLIDVVN